MNMISIAISAGLGAAVGAVGILMLSKTNPARRLASKAANKVEDVAWELSEKMTQKFDM